jgi:hypothetical protein
VSRRAGDVSPYLRSPSLKQNMGEQATRIERRAQRQYTDLWSKGRATKRGHPGQGTISKPRPPEVSTRSTARGNTP